MQTPQTENTTIQIIPISNNPNDSMSVNTPQVTQQGNQENQQNYKSFNNKVIIYPPPPPPPKPVKSSQPTKRITIPIKFNPESITTDCPFCGKTINTDVKKTFNIKAILTAIGTCFIGFACLQVCNNKKISCHDSIHTCPKCKGNIGTYHVI